MSDLIRALGVLAEPPGEATGRLADALSMGAGLPAASDFTDLFLFQLYPYASVYLSAEGMLGGEARGRVAGFWVALAMSPPPEPDHLAALLGLYAALAEDRSPEARHARKALLWEHLLSWLPPYLECVEQMGSAFYADWGRLVRAALLDEAGRLGPPGVLPLHMREAPGIVDPRREGGEAFLDSLLAPIRTGMIIARSDLVRCAAELGLGLRVGERRYVLRALFGQAPEAVLEWLGAEARAWSARHRRRPGSLQAVSGFWAQRSDAAAVLFAELLAERADLATASRASEA